MRAGGDRRHLANQQKANFSFRAATELKDGMHCTSKIRKFPPFNVDEPASFGGTNRGPSPVEILLAALGTCQEITYRIYASLMGIPLESVQCELSGHLDLGGFLGTNPSVRSGIQQIKYETKIKSSANPEALAELARTVECRCPILNTLQEPVEVVGFVTINGRPMAIEAAPNVAGFGERSGTL
jgi:uncharacterized OsmC-like protein